MCMHVCVCVRVYVCLCTWVHECMEGGRGCVQSLTILLPVLSKGAYNNGLS